MRRFQNVLICSTLLLALLLASAPAMAQEGQPPVEPLGLQVYTLYPVQEAAIGENVTFGLTLRTDGVLEMVRLDVQDLPAGWTAVFRGGGKIVRAAYVSPTEDTSVDLRLELPKDASADTYRLSVVAEGTSRTVRLPIELVVKDKLPPSLQFDVDLPTLRGPATTTFRFDTTLKNTGDEDLSVNLVADVAPQFQVDFKLAGQDVTSIPIAANESKRVSVEVKAFDEVSVGSYPVSVLAQGTEAQAALSLTVEVTGQAELTVTTPDGRLSGEAEVRKETSFSLVVRNMGSAPARNVEMSATPPSGWTVEFEPKQIAEIPTDQQVDVTAKVKPADQAVAGDYVITVRARPEGGSTDSEDLRITVVTSTLWGAVGVALIAVAVAVVALAVMRFGRR